MNYLSTESEIKSEEGYNFKSFKTNSKAIGNSIQNV